MNSELVTVIQKLLLVYKCLTRYAGANNDHGVLPASPDLRYGLDGQTIGPAVQYVQKIKQRCDPDTYRQFLDILSRYHHEPNTIDEVCFMCFYEYLTQDFVPRKKFQNRSPYFSRMPLISEQISVSSCQTAASN